MQIVAEYSGAQLQVQLLDRLRQEGYKFEANLDNVGRTCLLNKKGWELSGGTCMES